MNDLLTSSLNSNTNLLYCNYTCMSSTCMYDERERHDYEADQMISDIRRDNMWMGVDGP